jgi:hypothetical protein
MGIFDFFKKKPINQRIKEKSDKNEEITVDELKEFAKDNKWMLDIQREARKYGQEIRESHGVDTDTIPTGYGEYGLCLSNPIPTDSVDGSNLYLTQLRTHDGKKVEAFRRGSTGASDVTPGSIDIYELSVKGEVINTIYICPYHKRNSTLAPKGFSLVK